MQTRSVLLTLTSCLEEATVHTRVRPGDGEASVLMMTVSCLLQDLLQNFNEENA